MTLRHEEEPGATVDLELPQRSLYVLSGAARYQFTHAIDAHDDQRRISLIFRDELRTR